MKSTKTKLTLRDESPVETRARAACVKKINALFDSITRDIRKVGELGVAIANNAMQLGFFFQELSGHQQLEMHFFNSVEGLDSKLSFLMATRCVSLSRRRDGQKFESYAEAEGELKLLFQGSLTEPPERQRALGEPLVRNWGAWIPTAFTPINTQLKELFENEPIDQWSVERLEMFKAQTQFVYELHEAAEALLNEKA